MTENESIKNIRKDYHLYTYINNYKLKEGKKVSKNYVNCKNNNTNNGQGYMEIQLTAEEASRYDRNKIVMILKKKIYRNNKAQKYVHTKRIVIVCYRTVYFWRRKWL